MTGRASKVSPLSLVLETALDATVIMGADGRVRDWNRQAKATFGWTRQEAVGRPLADLIAPVEQRRTPVEGLHRYMETGVKTIVGRRIEVMAAHRDGRVFPVELSVSEIEEDGEIGFIGFIRDVSGRLDAEQALKVERDRSQSVLDNMLDGFVLLDRGLRVLQVNQAALRMEGRTAESMLGRTHGEIWPEPQAESLRERYKEVLRTRTPLVFEEQWVDPRGMMWLEIRAQPTPEGLAIFYRDVSKRKDAEEVLRASEARLRTLANVVPAMVWMSSAQGEVEFLNDRWFAFTGASKGQTENDPASFLHPDDAPRATELWAEAFGKREGFGAELRIRRSDGQFRWFLSRSEPVLDRRGEVAGWIGASIDIDDQRKAQERLELMVNELNHRVKNNLAAVQALAAQTFRGTESLAQAREAFTSRLVALSKAHDILTRQQWEGSQLAEIAQEVLAPNIPRTEALTIEGPNVSLGPNAALTLSMAFHELCTNALKYGALSTPQGQVALRWRVDAAGMLHLSWTELGGPPVSPPATTGFGSRLLTRSLAAELRGVVKMDFQATGVVCTIDAQLDRGCLGLPPARPSE
jgi:PAS domain S-box-containing protein